MEWELRPPLETVAEKKLLAALQVAGIVEVKFEGGNRYWRKHPDLERRK